MLKARAKKEKYSSIGLKYWKGRIQGQPTRRGPQIQQIL